LNTESLRSDIGQVTPILTSQTFELQVNDFHDEKDHDEEKSSVDMDDELRDVLSDKPSEPEPTTQ
jgi:hypothetical protein